MALTIASVVWASDPSFPANGLRGCRPSRSSATFSVQPPWNDQAGTIEHNSFSAGSQVEHSTSSSTAYRSQEIQKQHTENKGGYWQQQQQQQLPQQLWHSLSPAGRPGPGKRFSSSRTAQHLPDCLGDNSLSMFLGRTCALEPAFPLLARGIAAGKLCCMCIASSETGFLSGESTPRPCPT